MSDDSANCCGSGSRFAIRKLASWFTSCTAKQGAVWLSNAPTGSMGVTGLLRALKPVSIPVDVSDLRGMTLGVDGYGWLHRAVSSCAHDLVAGRETTAYLEYLERRVAVFLHSGVNLYIVFDGAPLPAKASVEASRKASRDCAREELSNNPGRASELAARAVDVSSEMAAAAATYFAARNIPFVVAPYEADAQLVYMERQGLVDAILSEDSDLLVFGAQKLLTKLEPSGSCIMVQAEDIGNAPMFRCLRNRLSSADDREQVLRDVAILNGCDYSDGISGVGLVKAATLVARYTTLENVLLMFESGKTPVPGTFRDKAQMAAAAFQFQRVWDPVQKAIVTLRSDPPANIDMAIGFPLDPLKASQIAKARICPTTGVFLRVAPHIAMFATRASQLRRAQTPHKLPISPDARANKLMDSTGRGASPFFSAPAKSRTESSDDVAASPASRSSQSGMSAEGSAGPAISTLQGNARLPQKPSLNSYAMRAAKPLEASKTQPQLSLFFSRAPAGSVDRKRAAAEATVVDENNEPQDGASITSTRTLHDSDKENLVPGGKRSKLSELAADIPVRIPLISNTNLASASSVDASAGLPQQSTPIPTSTATPAVAAPASEPFSLFSRFAYRPAQ